MAPQEHKEYSPGQVQATRKISYHIGYFPAIFGGTDGAVPEWGRQIGVSPWSYGHTRCLNGWIFLESCD